MLLFIATLLALSTLQVRGRRRKGAASVWVGSCCISTAVVAASGMCACTHCALGCACTQGHNLLRCAGVHSICLHPAQVCFASSRSLEAAAAAAATANIALPKSVGNRYKAAYHYVECEADYLVEPDNTQDVADAVKAYRQLAELQGAQLKIRASRRWVLQQPSSCSLLAGLARTVAVVCNEPD